MDTLDEHLIEDKPKKDGTSKSMVNRLLWSALNVGSKQGFRIIFVILLARILSPVEFGLVGMITLVIGYADTILNFGLGPALIQNKDANQTDYSSVFWLNIIIGISLMIIVSLMAPLIARFFDEESLYLLTLVLSTKYLMVSLGIVNKTLLLKRQEIKKLTIVEASSVFISGIIAIIMAWQGYGVWSLVAQILIQSFLFVTFLWFATKWRPSFVFSGQSIRSISSFSMNMFANQSMNYWTNNIDNLLIGKMLGGHFLGIYKNAYMLIFRLLGSLNGTLFNVLFPSYSLLKDNLDKMRASFYKAVGAMFYIVSPIMVVFFFFAHPMVLNIFSEEWIAMVFLLKCFSVAGIFMSLTAINGNVFLALGRSDLVFKANLIGKLIVVIGIVTGIYLDGINGVALSFVFTYPMSYLINNAFLFRLLKFDIKNYFLTLLPTLKVLVFFITGSYFLSFYIQGTIPFFVGLPLITISLYLILSWIFKPAIFKQLVIENRIVRKYLK